MQPNVIDKVFLTFSTSSLVGSILSTIKEWMCPVIHVSFTTSDWEKKNQQRPNAEAHIEKKVHQNVDYGRLSWRMQNKFDWKRFTDNVVITIYETNKI